MEQTPEYTVETFSDSRDLEKELNKLAQSAFKVVAITQHGSHYTLVWATH